MWDIVVIPQVGGLHHRYQRHAAECYVRRSSTTITSVRLMNQSNLVASRNRIFLRTLRLAMESSVTSMLQGCLDQFLRERVSADEIFGNDRHILRCPKRA
jgi:hypothetical protein